MKINKCSCTQLTVVGCCKGPETSIVAQKMGKISSVLTKEFPARAIYIGMSNIIEKYLHQFLNSSLPFHKLRISINVLQSIKNVRNALVSLHLQVLRAHCQRCAEVRKSYLTCNSDDLKLTSVSLAILHPLTELQIISVFINKYDNVK